MSSIRKVCVVGGLGSLGAPMAEWIDTFYDVVVADVRPPGLLTMEASANADVVIVIVDTPSFPDGSFDIGNVLDACIEIETSRWRLVMISSTVNPGDVNGTIAEAFRVQAHKDVGLVYAPEFVRQGSVQADFARPDFVVVGAQTRDERKVAREFYETVCSTTPIFMSVESAEVMKIGLNTMVTAKLAKVNEIAWLCQHTPGADAHNVLKAIALDGRISNECMAPGPPDGGPCFPRDGKAMARALERVAVWPSVCYGVADFRHVQVAAMAGLVVQEGADLGALGVTYGVLGLGFKPGLSDATESAAMALAETLEAETWDPGLPSTCDTLKACVGQCDVLIIANPCEGMRDLLEMDLTGKTVWDWWGVFGDRYRRFGRCLPSIP